MERGGGAGEGPREGRRPAHDDARAAPRSARRRRRAAHPATERKPLGGSPRTGAASRRCRVATDPRRSGAASRPSARRRLARPRQAGFRRDRCPASSRSAPQRRRRRRTESGHPGSPGIAAPHHTEAMKLAAQGNTIAQDRQRKAQDRRRLRRNAGAAANRPPSPPCARRSAAQATPSGASRRARRTSGPGVRTKLGRPPISSAAPGADLRSPTSGPAERLKDAVATAPRRSR